MAVLKMIHQVLAFGLELTMLGALGLWGFRTGRTTAAAWALAIGIPLLAIVVWGIWLAPRSASRVDLPYRAGLILALFLLSACGLHQMGSPRLALLFASLAVVSTALTFVFPN